MYFLLNSMFKLIHKHSLVCSLDDIFRNIQALARQRKKFKGKSLFGPFSSIFILTLKKIPQECYISS